LKDFSTAMITRAGKDVNAALANHFECIKNFFKPRESYSEVPPMDVMTVGFISHPDDNVFTR
jgi:hypothetical protein